MDNLLKQLAYEWEKEKSMLHSTIYKYKKELEDYPNQITQISCDCMVGGDCECEDNCANGMRILKMKKEIDELNEKNDKYEGAYNGYGCKELYEENKELKEGEAKAYDYIIEKHKLEKENKELKEKLQSIYQEDGS